MALDKYAYYYIIIIIIIIIIINVLQLAHDVYIAGRYVAEQSVFISDEAVDTNSIHSTLQVVEILDKNFPFLNCICYE